MRSNRKRLLSVGGVAGGASCAARARRLDEACEITVISMAIQHRGTVFDLEEGYAPHAVTIPLTSLRSNLEKLPRDREIRTYCYAGQCS